jgi:hypothetical protein
MLGSGLWDGSLVGLLGSVSVEQRLSSPLGQRPIGPAAWRPGKVVSWWVTNVLMNIISSRILMMDRNV